MAEADVRWERRCGGEDIVGALYAAARVNVLMYRGVAGEWVYRACSCGRVGRVLV